MQRSSQVKRGGKTRKHFLPPVIVFYNLPWEITRPFMSRSWNISSSSNDHTIRNLGLLPASLAVQNKNFPLPYLHASRLQPPYLRSYEVPVMPLSPLLLRKSASWPLRTHPGHPSNHGEKDGRCNGDGVLFGLALIPPLAQHLLSKGYNVGVCAPGENSSARGLRITLGSPSNMLRHHDYEQRFSQPLDKTNHSNSPTTSASLRTSTPLSREPHQIESPVVSKLATVNWPSWASSCY